MNNEEILSKIYLVMDKLMNLGGANYEDDCTVDKEHTNRGVIARDFGIEEWDWPQGVGLYGLLKLSKYYKDNRYIEFFDKWYADNILKGLPSKNINTTAPYLVLVELLDEFKNSEYEKMCLEHAKWLVEELPKTKEGGFQHVVTSIGNRNGVLLNEEEIWIDTLFMAVLFLNKMGQKFKNEVWISESLHQILIHIKYLYDKQTGLFYHGWSFIRNDNFGGVFWCRGNSWFTYGVLELIETYNGTIDNGVETFLINIFKAQVSMLCEKQSESGLWHTVILDSKSYEEVSGSAAIAAGILKGIKMGILDKSYKKCAELAIEAICNNIDKDGTVLNVSAGTGMGYDIEHYKNIMVRPMAYGQSLALIALVEALN